MRYSGQVITSGTNALLEGDEDNSLKEGDEHEPEAKHESIS